MEDRGYLVAHPTLIDPKGHAPAEQQHITHKVNNRLPPSRTDVHTLNIPSNGYVFSFHLIFATFSSILLPGAAGGQ